MIIYYERHAEIEPMYKLGLSRIEAAAYVGVSPSLFDTMVDDGRMPRPVRINARAVYDRRAVEDAWSRLAGRGEGVIVQAASDENPLDALLLPAAMRRVS